MAKQDVPLDPRVISGTTTPEEYAGLLLQELSDLGGTSKFKTRQEREKAMIALMEKRFDSCMREVAMFCSVVAAHNDEWKSSKEIANLFGQEPPSAEDVHPSSHSGSVGTDDD